MTCLLAELFPFLTLEGHDKLDPDTRRTALRMTDVLLQQRSAIMKDLLAPEVGRAVRPTDTGSRLTALGWLACLAVQHERITPR